MILAILTLVIALTLFISASIASKTVLAIKGEKEEKRKLARMLLINLSLLGVVGLIIGASMMLLERDIVAVFVAYVVFVPIVLVMMLHGVRSYLGQE